MIPFQMFLFLVIVMCSPLHALINLEERAQELVLESKQIFLEEYPDAFNPSIIRWNGSLLLSFRVIPDPNYIFTSHIGLVWLDENFSPIGSPQLLNTQTETSLLHSIIPSRAEDARLIEVGNRLYLVYSDNKNLLITRGGFRVYIAEVKYDGVNFTIHNCQCLDQFEGESWLKREKNWVPFDYHEQLMLAYSLNPHLILRPSMVNGTCKTVSSTSNEIKWEWGDLRGGTSGVLEGNEYLSFFHSSIDMPSVQSNGKIISHYFMGAYTFSSEPPFNITQVSVDPIIGKGFYSGKEYKPYWKPIKAIFPCGFISDENHIWLAYGKQDHEIWITKLDKSALFKSLIKVESVGDR
ncbi:MAG: hypothetical protein H0W50_05565 [Parachlamydiaceae bacterium]|nr:hypothetical protein [Parachlamydiaceae bacterium]